MARGSAHAHARGAPLDAAVDQASPPPMELQLLHITVRDDLPAPVDARAYAADPLRAHSGLAGQAAQASQMDRVLEMQR